MSDSLTEFISAPISPLPERWRSAVHTEAATAARALHAQDPDEYWAWAAGQQRWIRPWQTLRTGELGDCRYFEGGQINVADNCVDRWAEDPASAGRTAVIWEGEPGEIRTVTYSELAHEVGRLAAGLRQLGIARGDVVGIYMPNLVEAIASIQACNRIGAIYTVLFSGFGEDAVASRLSLADAKAVIVADASYRRERPVELLEILRAARRRAPTVEHVIVVDRTGRGVALRQDESSYRELVDAQGRSAPLEPLASSDPAFLIFTSGTESQPKGVVHSVGGFLVGTWANVRWQVGPEPGDVYWVAADVGWLTFPIQAAVGGLAQGMTLVCYEGALNVPSPARFYEICARHRATKVLAAPTVLRMLRGFGDDLAAAHPLPDLRLVTVQGEPLDGETFTWATEHLGGGVPVVNAYGQTETGSTWTYPIYGVDDLKAGSVGTPVPGHEYAVLSDAGEPVAPGVKGNLVLTRPFPTLAYTVWRDHQRYLSTYFERFPGCYATWDEAVVDVDGHLWVLGRADDVINIAAHRISTMEIEASVASHADVTEAAVVGVPHPTKGTVPVAFITVRASADADTVSAEARRTVAAQIGGYAQLEAVYVTPAMPKTRTGKIMRRLLRDIVVRGAPVGDISAMDDASALEAVTIVVQAGRASSGA
ncbi:MAG: AMP-binding protein [Solirubrobacterales bacterium]|nr:AMP-binding protein [Solirubrobacterales bacterium]